jgi:beta-barrel assembly-enhancing protease
MEQIFQGKFYNGLSSLGYEASILLEDHAILIGYVDKEEQEQTVSWNIAQMHKNEFIDKERVTLQYGSFPPQSLEVQSAEFIKLLKAKYIKKPFMQSNYHFLANKGLKGVLIGGSVCVSLLLVFYFFGIPTIAESVAEKFPIKYEEELGEKLHDAFIRGYTVDSAKTVLVNDFYKELKYPSEHHIKITVVDLDMVNAFAVPGGNIVVFNGILEKMKHGEELAALLAHEASHVELRHSTKSMFRSLANYLFISLVFYDVNAIASILIDNANMLAHLSYSRNLEQEADKNGLNLMADRKINPQGMIQLFELLKEESQPKRRIKDTKDRTKEIEEEEPNEFMSTHPLLNNRIQYIRETIEIQEIKFREHEELNQLWEKIVNSRVKEDSLAEDEE